MRLRATVRRVTGRTTHLIGAQGEILPDPKAVEIVELEKAVYLLRLDEDGQCIADTWHATVEAAKAQASFEYETDGDWKDVDACL